MDVYSGLYRHFNFVDLKCIEEYLLRGKDCIAVSKDILQRRTKVEEAYVKSLDAWQKESILQLDKLKSESKYKEVGRLPDVLKQVLMEAENTADAHRHLASKLARDNGPIDKLSLFKRTYFKHKTPIKGVTSVGVARRHLALSEFCQSLKEYDDILGKCVGVLDDIDKSDKKLACLEEKKGTVLAKKQDVMRSGYLNYNLQRERLKAVDNELNDLNSKIDVAKSQLRFARDKGVLMMQNTTEVMDKTLDMMKTFHQDLVDIIAEQWSRGLDLISELGEGSDSRLSKAEFEMLDPAQEFSDWQLKAVVGRRTNIPKDYTASIQNLPTTPSEQTSPLSPRSTRKTVAPPVALFNIVPESKKGVVNTSSSPMHTASDMQSESSPSLVRRSSRQTTESTTAIAGYDPESKVSDSGVFSHVPRCWDEDIYYDDSFDNIYENIPFTQMDLKTPFSDQNSNRRPVQERSSSRSSKRSTESTTGQSQQDNFPTTSGTSPNTSPTKADNKTKPSPTSFIARPSSPVPPPLPPPAAMEECEIEADESVDEWSEGPPESEEQMSKKLMAHIEAMRNHVNKVLVAQQDYTAKREGEITMKKGDKLRLRRIEDGSNFGFGWIITKKRNDRVLGFFPLGYVNVAIDDQ